MSDRIDNDIIEVLQHLQWLTRNVPPVITVIPEPEYLLELREVKLVVAKILEKIKI